MPIHLVCQNCGKPYTTKPGRAAKSKACSKPCLGEIQRIEFKGWQTNPNPLKGPESGGWKGGVSWRMYVKHRKGTCERCGSTRHLLVHHINEIRSDNRLENLETLCKACHQNHHCRRDPKTGKYLQTTV